MSTDPKPDLGDVGLVGLGLVGRAVAHRLSLAGYVPLGFDHRDEANAEFVRAGGRVAASLVELGERCACVVLAVFDTAGVLEVVEGPDGLLKGRALRALIDCSTGDPDALRALAGRLAARSVDFIEAPLSGSSQQIREGQATMLLGADATAPQRHAALLDALAPQRIVVGGAGMGARAKLATNLVLGLNRAALAEGLVFAERLGIASEAFLALVLATPARSDAALAKGALMVSGRFDQPQSRSRQRVKGGNLMLEQAAA